MSDEFDLTAGHYQLDIHVSSCVAPELAEALLERAAKNFNAATMELTNQQEVREIASQMKDSVVELGDQLLKLVNGHPVYQLISDSESCKMIRFTPYMVIGLGWKSVIQINARQVNAAYQATGVGGFGPHRDGGGPFLTVVCPLAGSNPTRFLQEDKNQPIADGAIRALQPDDSRWIPATDASKQQPTLIVAKAFAMRGRAEGLQSPIHSRPPSTGPGYKRLSLKYDFFPR